MCVIGGSCWGGQEQPRTRGGHFGFARSRGRQRGGRGLVQSKGAKLHVADLGAQHAFAELLALPNDPVARWYFGAGKRPCTLCSAASSRTLVNHLQIQDDAVPLGLPGLHLAVDDAHGLRKRRDGWAQARAAPLWVWSWQGAAGHAVAAADVFLKPMHRGTGVQLG